jgi:hypothetical protein
MWQARQRAKTVGYKYVWLKNGKIFARKEDEMAICHIKNEGDVSRKMV